MNTKSFKMYRGVQMAITMIDTSPEGTSIPVTWQVRFAVDGIPYSTGAIEDAKKMIDRLLGVGKLA